MFFGKKEEQEPTTLYEYGNRMLSADDVLEEMFKVARTSTTGYIRVPVPIVHEESLPTTLDQPHDAYPSSASMDVDDLASIVEYDSPAPEQRGGLLGWLFGR